jgi:hypothetical protein
LNFFTMAHFEVLHILHPCKKVGSWLYLHFLG